MADDVAAHSDGSAVASDAMAAEPRLCTLHVGDDPSTWRTAGFDVSDGLAGWWVQLGAVRIQLHGSDGPRGLLRWDLDTAGQPGPTPGATQPTSSADIDGLPTAWAPDTPELPLAPAPTPGATQPTSSADIDGLPTAWAPDAPELPLAPAPTHPNRVNAIDHVVVSSPDVDRTVGALTDQGFRERRRRTTGRYGEPMVQVFFWVGDVILELVGPTDVPAGEVGPAAFFGLALISTDLEATAAGLGELLGTPREAVQPGRLIATLRLERLGGSVPTVIMSQHPGDPASA